MFIKPPEQINYTLIELFRDWELKYVIKNKLIF